MDTGNSNASMDTDSGNYVGVLNKLRVVKDLAPGSDILADIVYIPGTGMSPPTDWSWVHAAARVLAFDYDVGLRTPFAWEDLLDSAKPLLADLVVLANKKHPIIFICHSCGGLILKQTLWDIGQQPHELKYRYISNVISGVVFLGTPHSKNDKDKRWDRLPLILKSNPNLKTFKEKDPYALPEYIAQRLAKLSKHFEQLDLQIPVLSVFEEKETKVKRLGWVSKDVILVGEVFARAFPNAQNEELIGVKASHHDMGNILKTLLDERINRFITAVMKDAPNIIAEKFRRSEVPFEPEDITVRSHSSRPSSLPDNVAEDHFTDANSVASTAGSSDLEFEIIPTTLEDFPVQTKQLRLPCYITTPYEQSLNFVGREDVLKMLDDALLPPSAEDSPSALASSVVRELRSFALCGMGGVGKTSIAIQFVFTRKKKFDAIFFVHADELTKLAAGFCQIALELGLEDSINAKDQVVSRGLVNGFLDNPPKVNGRDARWLIVFDNADKLNLLNEFWPEHANGSVLVTSRDPLAMQSTHFANSGVHLSPLDIDHASTLLKKLTHTTAPKGSAEEVAALGLATRLGGLPLAIMHIAGSVNQKQLSLSECLEKYKEDENIRELHERELGRLGRKPKPRESLATVWALDALSPGAAALLQILSLMDPDRIDESILTRLSISVPLKNSEYPLSNREFENARTELIRLSLVKRNAEKKQLWIHRVLQDEARTRMPSYVLEADFETLVALLSAAWPFVKFENRHSKSRWPDCQKIFPHVLRLKSFYEDCVAPNNIFRASASFAALLNEAGWYHHERGCSQDAKPFLFLALSLAEQICMSLASSSTVRPLLSDIHYGLGAIATETNEPAACLKHYSELLKMQQEDFEQTGRHTRRLGVAFNEMGNAYMMNTHYHEAVKMFKEAIKAYKSVDGFLPRMLSLPLVNLGLAYWLTKNLPEAERVLLEALREREREFGVDDIESFKPGRILHALGNVRASQGRFDDSFELHKRALKQYKSSIGLYHHRTADLYHKVAEHHVRLEDHATAQILLDQALKIYGGRPYYKPEIARCNFKKGMSLVAIGKMQEAQQALDEALGLYYEIVGKERGKSLEQLVDADFDELVVFWTK